MTRALVLMKAMPPTKGHERLLSFAASIASRGVVLIDTAPGEPMVKERVRWVREYVSRPGWTVCHLELDDQNPESDGFWERWKNRIRHQGEFDFVVGSEPYCSKVAEVIGAQWIPYDQNRELSWIHATQVRNHPSVNFAQVATDFQKHMRTTVTIFGAESTGKTTLSKAITRRWYADVEWVFEWARPYLEATGRTVCDLNDMHNIWRGQYAAETNAEKFAVDKSFIVRDTDLYSTIGYWEQPHWIDTYGPVPNGLISDAAYHKADLYIITGSNIPFEKDPLRYGGDHRESPDSYWISVAEKYGLNYVVLTDTNENDRLNHAAGLARHVFEQKNAELMKYDRELVSK